MSLLKLIRYADKTNDKIEVILNGFIRISSNGVLQIYTEPDFAGKASGICILALPEGEWLSAEAIAV